jgi:hypothetical protein
MLGSTCRAQHEEQASNTVVAQDGAHGLPACHDQDGTVGYHWQ